MPNAPPPEMTSGFQPLDAEHASLLARCDAAVAAARAGDAAAVREAVAALLAEARAHFRSEEAAMEALSFAERGRHASAHAVFLGEVTELAHAVDRHGLTPPLVERLVTVVPTWLRFHIQVNDQPLGRTLARGGQPKR